MIDLDGAIALAERLADAAASEIRPRFRQIIPTERKADISPVTEADRSAELAVRSLLQSQRPEDGIAGEEFGVTEGESGLVWVIDPIDGTKAFMTGRPTFVTLLALLDHGTPVLGVIDQPITHDRWIGASGRATLLNGRAVRTRACPRLEDAIFSTTDPDLFPGADHDVYRKVAMSSSIRTYGGDGFAYGLLASGWVDIVLESGLKLHDFAALAPVIAGAGGTITDWEGGPLHAGSDGRILATGDADLHARLLRTMVGPASV
jgi:histidinol phosphatase-like enzyme (inositol monophosphatase family)